MSESDGKLASMEEELLSTKKETAASEQRFTAAISTIHLNQVENEHKEKLGKEEFTKKHMERFWHPLEQIFFVNRTGKPQLHPYVPEVNSQPYDFPFY